jgi:hypothetical protein
VCANISGSWVAPVCTIPAGVNGVATSDFRIAKPNTLEVRGSLTVPEGVTLLNAGNLLVENSAGVPIGDFDDSGLLAGILLFGFIDNSGTVTIRNTEANTVGIAISVTVSEFDPTAIDPFVVVPGVLSNLGMVQVQNTGSSQGINNLGTLYNAASGSISLANALTGSVGIRNRRDSTIASQYYLVGDLTNAGILTTGNGGDGSSRGLSNSGAFTNTATGTFTIGASSVTDPLAYGFRNNGTFTNVGTFINNRGQLDDIDYLLSTWGCYNIGTMINYGVTFVGSEAVPVGSFYNEAILLNIGDITTYGTLFDAGGYMVNYATIYNFGLIVGGANLGICLDEPSGFGGC